MSDIVISEFMDESAVARLAERFDTLFDPLLVDSHDELQKALAGCRALIVRNRTQVTGDLLDAGPDLQCVGRLGVGLDNIDMAACQARNVTVFPATGANDLAVAEYVIASILMLFRGSYHSRDAMIAGQWPRQQSMGHEISGKRLGLIGFGAIARQVATRARALGMDVMAFDPMLSADDPAWNSVECCDLPRLVAKADAISLHVPLTDETRNMFSRPLIEAMKNSAILINTSRGGVVDEDALADALRSGSIGGAALDVFSSEPLGIEAGKRFADCPNLILTPHIAGVTKESNMRVSHLIADLVIAHLDAS